ncbi:MAG: oligosaccharide flippase family protein [Chitinophagales bacterium]
MGIVKRQGSLASIFSYIGVIIGSLNTLWLFPEYIGSEKFGLFQLIIAFSLMFSRLSLSGTPKTVIKFNPYFVGKDNLSFVYFIFSSVFLGFMICSGLFFILKPFLSLVYSENATLFIKYIGLILPIAFFMAYFEILISFSKANIHTVVPSFLRDVVIRVLISLLIILYIYEYIDFNYFLKAIIGVYFIVSVSLLGYLVHHKIFSIAKISFLNIKSKYREMMKYGFFALFNNIAIILRERIDILMIAALMGLSDVGVYSIAFFMASVISIPSNSISQVVEGLLSKYIKNNDMLNVKDIYKKTALNQLIISGIIFIGIVCNLHNVFILIPKFIDGYWVIVFIGLARLTNVSTGCNGLIIINSDFYKMSFYSSLFLVGLLFITNLILIPLYGISGAAFATFLSIFINNAFNIIVVYYKYRIQPFTLSFLALLFFLIVIFFMGYFIPLFDNVFIDIGIRSFTMGISYVAIVYFSKISRDFNDLVDSNIEKIKLIF